MNTLPAGLDEGVPNPPVVVEAEVAHPSRATSATPLQAGHGMEGVYARQSCGSTPHQPDLELATLPTWGERRNTGRGPWRPFDGSEPDVDPDTGDERATTDAEGNPA